MKQRGKVIDKLLLLGAALIVAVLTTAAAWISDAHHISPAWLFSFWAGIGFFMGIGKTYGLRKLRSPKFAIFSAAWLLVHVWVYLLVLGYLGFFYYLPLVVVELFIGFMIAILLFGPPDRGRIMPLK